MIRNQRTILMLAIGMILTVSIVIAFASGVVGPATAVSVSTDPPNEIVQSSVKPGSTGSMVIDSTEPNSPDSLSPSAAVQFSATATSALEPSSTATPSPTRDGDDNRTPTVTPSPNPASSGPPSGNLLVNPYFEGQHGSTSIPGWVNSGQWDISVKPHNPSPNITAARINDAAQSGFYTPGGIAVLHQVVQGNGTNLAATIACVQHYAEVMDVTILGSQSSGGPWTPVWQPFAISVCGFADWGPTVSAQTQLPQTWAFYQYQIVARFEDERGGVKVTDVSLSIN